MTDIETRLAALERQNRWFKRGAAALLVIAGGGVLMGAAVVPAEVRTRQLTIVDANDHAREVMMVLPSGLAGFGIMNAAGEMTVYAEVNEKGDSELRVGPSPNPISAGMTRDGRVFGNVTVAERWRFPWR